MRKVKIATAKGERTVEANVYRLNFDGGTVAVFVHKEGFYPVLSHYTSGRQINKLPIVALTKYPERDVAQETLDWVTAKYGTEKVREQFQKHPTINP